MAAAYYASPTPENRAVFRAVCMPWYNTTSGDPDLPARVIVNDGISRQFFSGEARDMDFRPVLSRIACPTLVVAGAKDPRVPLPLAQMIADALQPGLGRLEVFVDCGHGPHVEQPEQAMALLRDFILA